MIYGYARVSAYGQNLASQLEQLNEAGATKIFQDTMSGVRGDRPQFRRMLRTVQSGDTVIVTRLDRLARSTLDLLTTLADLTQRGVQFKSLAQGWADTTTPQGRLMVTMLGGFAEFERELILARTIEGRKRAKAAGVHVGRRPSLDHFQRREALARKEAGAPNGSIARGYGVSASTISRLKAENTGQLRVV